MEKDKYLTIITPTYNRASLLSRCFQSLNVQTCKNFQWLIVDDGSTDNTEEIVLQLKEKSDFEIDYIRKTNGGKHTALNASHPYINGKFVTVVDSDDYLTNTAVEEILNTWKMYENSEDVGMVIFLKGFSEEHPICTGGKDYEIVDTITTKRIGNAGRDCFDVFRSELFIKYPFPEFEGEKFIGEGASFFFIELEKKGVYVNKVLYICDYREDGLTKAGRKMRIKNPLGGRYNSQIYMHPRLPMKTRIKKGMLYTCYSLFASVHVSKIFSENRYKILTAITFLPGYCLYLYWKNKYM